MLMSAAVETGQWWWIAVILAGGILAGGYVLRILGPCLSEADASMVRPVSRLRQCIVLTLAVLSVGLGLFPQRPLELLRGGRPLHAVAETANPLPAPISR
jgi:formate hydrogenlyase subunit 3/multisubunit Na+/H+ antiporter MnhD subunit